MAWLVISLLLAGAAFAKAWVEVFVTVVTDTVTITDAFAHSHPSRLFWSHRFMSSTANFSFINQTNGLFSTKMNSAVVTQPATSTNEVTSTSTTTSTPSGSSGSYSQPILDQHNNHRANCSALPLIWSNDLAHTAAQIASSCIYTHNTTANGGGYGQNIGAGAEPLAVPALITNEMYNNEINWYPSPYGSNNPDMTNFEKWGHYSQIVWNSTTEVGCATQYCPNGLANTGSDISPYFTVCNYFPPGNVAGQYRNVGNPAADLPTIVLE